MLTACAPLPRAFEGANEARSLTSGSVAGVAVGMVQSEASRILNAQGFELKGTHGCADQETELCQTADGISTYRKDANARLGYIEVYTKSGQITGLRWWQRPRELS